MLKVRDLDYIIVQSLGIRPNTSYKC
jgi:hypothetical protein